MKKNLILLSDEELRDIVLRKQLEYIKLCQDDFLTFVQEVWPDFIYRKTNKKMIGVIIKLSLMSLLK
jgi:hypothetical protein